MDLESAILDEILNQIRFLDTLSAQIENLPVINLTQQDVWLLFQNLKISKKNRRYLMLQNSPVLKLAGSKVESLNDRILVQMKKRLFPELLSQADLSSEPQRNQTTKLPLRHKVKEAILVELLNQKLLAAQLMSCRRLSHWKATLLTDISDSLCISVSILNEIRMTINICEKDLTLVRLFVHALNDFLNLSGMLGLNRNMGWLLVGPGRKRAKAIEKTLKQIKILVQNYSEDLPELELVGQSPLFECPNHSELLPIVFKLREANLNPSFFVLRNLKSNRIENLQFVISYINPVELLLKEKLEIWNIHMKDNNNRSHVYLSSIQNSLSKIAAFKFALTEI